MFHKNYSKTIFTSVIFLMALCAILSDSYGQEYFFIVFKPLTTILILLFAVVYANKKNSYYRWVVLALCFCLLGDVLLLVESYFIGGLVAFLIAHLCFACSFISLDGFKKYLVPLIFLLVFGVTYYSILYDSLKGLKIPVLVYFVIIILMSWQGISLRIWKDHRSFTMIAIAVVLFLISDSVLAWSKFKSSFQLSGVLVLATYWSSIFLIAVSTIEHKIESRGNKD